jgi:PadR family transcriptional regulator PadR
MTLIRSRGFYGEIDILVLKTLSGGKSMHGLAIIDAVRKSSGDYLQIEDAALYPALHRLHRKGLLKGEWQISDKKRRAKFYEITPAGRKELARALEEWTTHTRAMGQVLEIQPEDLR